MSGCVIVAWVKNVYVVVAGGDEWICYGCRGDEWLCCCCRG